jgi:hypothetical protein
MYSCWYKAARISKSPECAKSHVAVADNRQFTRFALLVINVDRVLRAIANGDGDPTIQYYPLPIADWFI